MSCTTGMCAPEPSEPVSPLETAATIGHQGIIGTMLENGVTKGTCVRLVIPRGALYTNLYEVLKLTAQSDFRVTGEVSSIGLDHVTLTASVPIQNADKHAPALGMWQFYNGGISRYEELVPKQPQQPSQ